LAKVPVDDVALDPELLGAGRERLPCSAGPGEFVGGAGDFAGHRGGIQGIKPLADLGDNSFSTPDFCRGGVTLVAQPGEIGEDRRTASAT